MAMLGKVVNYLIKPFSWRKNIPEYKGKAVGMLFNFRSYHLESEIIIYCIDISIGRLTLYDYYSG